ncbi:MAG: FecR domain-containing protein [bacterium]
MDERRVEVGTVVYVEGAPQVFRDGEVMSNPADFGFPVESFDLLRTGSDDLLEIETNPDLGTEARIVVQPESVLYLDMSVLRSSSDGGSRSAIELVHGSMTVVVDRLSRDGTFEVAMDSTTLGVRGTTFNVDVAFNGNVLVTAEEGRVEVRDARGRILFADPERAVEWLDPARFRNIGLGTAVPDRDGIRSFRRRWIADRLQELRRNPAALLRVQAQRYLEARQELTRVYRLLMARRDVLDQWIDEERRLLRSSRDARSRQLERVAPHLRSALPILRRYERLHYQLRRTAELYRAEGLDPELPVTDDLTAEELFALVEGDVAVFERRMNVIRYVAKLYVRRNSGVLPQPENAAE